MPNIFRKNIRNQYNVDAQVIRNRVYAKNVAMNYTNVIYDDILNNLAFCIESNVCKKQQFETVAQVTNDINFYLDTSFVYRVDSKTKTITFENLKVASTLRGMGILTNVLRKLETYADLNDVIIEVAELGNVQLAMYLGKRRGYKLYTGRDMKKAVTNFEAAEPYLRRIEKASKEGKFMDRMKAEREMISLDLRPSYAIRKPKK